MVVGVLVATKDWDYEAVSTFPGAGAVRATDDGTGQSRSRVDGV